MKDNRSFRVFVNREIRAQEVQCIDQNNRNLGTIQMYEALKLAEKVNLDLVMISKPKGKPPICKILDAGKYKYDLSKRQKEQAKKQRESLVKIKEIKFRPTTDFNDLKVKAKHAEEFLNDGCKVKVSVNFKGREIAHQDIAHENLKKFISLINNIELIEPIQINGKSMTCIISLNK